MSSICSHSTLRTSILHYFDPGPILPPLPCSNRKHYCRICLTYWTGEMKGLIGCLSPHISMHPAMLPYGSTSTHSTTPNPSSCTLTRLCDLLSTESPLTHTDPRASSISSQSSAQFICCPNTNTPSSSVLPRVPSLNKDWENLPTHSHFSPPSLSQISTRLF